MTKNRYHPKRVKTILSPAEAKVLRAPLETLYKRLNRPQFISPDPLEVLGKYNELRDREVAAMVGATLAYGRVAQILKSVYRVLEILGEHPAAWLEATTSSALAKPFESFVHRFTKADDIVALLLGIKRAQQKHKTLEATFLQYLKPEDETVVPALDGFVSELCGDANTRNSLLSRPSRGSACKRLHLFLRWMCRKDAVDPGGWNQVGSKRLVIPLDTHMHRMAKSLGLTDRNAGNMATALQVTDSFRAIAPEDPVRYDFALTRLGIRDDETPETFLSSLKRTVKK